MFKIRFALVELIAILLLVVISTGIYSFVAWQKHYHFQTFAWDTSVFLQELYFTSQFKEPYSSMVKINGLGDHFQVLFLIMGTSLFIFWSDPKALFFLQSFIFSLSVIPLYLLLKLILEKFKISEYLLLLLGLSLSISYLFSVSSQGMMTDEFHNEPLLAFPLLFTVYFLLRRRWLGFWISYIGVLLTKEIFPLLGVPLGVYLFIKTKDFKKAILTASIGLLVFYLLVSQVMPYLSQTSGYLHFTEGNSPQYLIEKFTGNPTLLITEFFNHPEKTKTIFISFLSFGFLPLLSPVDLILPTSALGIRFFDDTTPRLWDFNNHYAVPLISFMAVATIFGIKKLLDIFSKTKKIHLNYLIWLISGYLIICTVISDLVFHGSLNSILKKQFYEISEWEKDAHSLIGVVPNGVTIASQNSLLPHLSLRDNFYLLPSYQDAEYIAVDLAPGPNKFSPLRNSAEMKQLIDELILTEKYFIVWSQGQSLLLKRN